MTAFTHVLIIYNPKSTGDSKQNAIKFKEKLEAAAPSLDVALIPTKAARHALDLAEQLAKEYKNSLIVSSSGDGGYHEVVNGIMRANTQGYHSTAGLLPSGNANDHYTALHEGDTIKRIISGDSRAIDLLAVSITKTDNSLEKHFAHSYIGLGLTPTVGKKLNLVKLHWFNEKWIVLKGLLQPNRTTIYNNDRKYTYDHLVFSNISNMAKVMSLSDDASVSDGKFEINGKRHTTILSLLAYLLRASTVGLTAKRVSSYEFSVKRPTDVQLDGEIYHIEAFSTVRITVESKLLKCII